MATNLIDLIDKINADDLPTNEFTIEDKDPMVILGKLNEVIAYLQTLQANINASDSKANEALQKAIQAVADATQALNVANGIDAKATQALANAIEAVGTANTALSASNTALSTANTAISTANTALSSANNAVETAESAETKADTAITTANGAKTTAEGIDAKATQALANSQTAITTANTAETKAQNALDQVTASLGTKVYRDNTLLNTYDVKDVETTTANNTSEINALQSGKVDKVTGKQLSTEDFTTAEKNKLAELNNYDDTQMQADITALQTRATNIETKNTEQDTTLTNLQDQINTKVDKVTGKGLSANDFTTELLNKLNGIASGAQVNTINSVAGYTGNVTATNLITAILTGKVGYGIAIDKQSLSKNGYIKFNNGLLIQWGEVRSSNTREHVVTFPIAYTTLYTVVATYYNNSNDNTKEWNIRYEKNTGFSIKKNTNEGAESGCNWIAIGNK